MTEDAISSISIQGESLNNSLIFTENQLYQEQFYPEKNIFGGDYIKELEKAFYFNPQSAQEENHNNIPQPAQEESSGDNLKEGQEENQNNIPQPAQEDSSKNNLHQGQEKNQNIFPQSVQEDSSKNNLHQGQEKNQNIIPQSAQRESSNNNLQQGQDQIKNSQQSQDLIKINNSQSCLNKDSQSAQEKKPNNYSKSIQETGLNNDSQIDKEESLINYCQLPQKESQNSALTEIEIRNQKYNPSNINEEEVIGQNANIPNQNNKKIKFSTVSSQQTLNSTNFIQKKIGRREKDSAETGGHTKNAKDNLRKKNWRLVIKSILNLLNAISSPLKIKLTNFEIQYGNNIIDNEEFLDIQIYKYFLYDKNYKKDSYYNLDNNKNHGIIYKMICEEKNQLYCAVMESTIGEMYRRFKNNEKYIIFKGQKYILPNFKTFNDFKNEKIYPEKQLNILKTLVDYIKIDGPKIKKKKESTRNLDYIINPELESQLNRYN